MEICLKQEELISFKSVNFKYPSSQSLLFKDFNFSIPYEKDKIGRFVTILGPSGCGKTTLLKLLAGLIAPISGEIQIIGQLVVSPSKNCGMVFQNYTSFDWLTVLENVRFPLEILGMPINEATNKARIYLKMVGLTENESCYPRHLSGGMRQRLAIARSLINKPDLLLMDEPFGAIDNITREDMQNNLLNIWLKTQNSIFFVTHDIIEAIFLGEEIIVLTLPPVRIYSRHKISFNYESRVPDLKYQQEFIKLVKLIKEEIRNVISYNKHNKKYLVEMENS
ncbi:MAG: ABC transporter ATP-binding protein [Desulfobacterales bacterium]|nr:ABC transporter ATP-binding protein [Desulfobacterales bacterium]MBF0395696.1 ABC transporter ATP-binding protein [Desulfobacterales bacterium]